MNLKYHNIQNCNLSCNAAGAWTIYLFVCSNCRKLTICHYPILLLSLSVPLIYQRHNIRLRVSITLCLFHRVRIGLALMAIRYRWLAKQSWHVGCGISLLTYKTSLAYHMDSPMKPFSLILTSSYFPPDLKSHRLKSHQDRNYDNTKMWIRTDKI